MPIKLFSYDLQWNYRDYNIDLEAQNRLIDKDEESK